MSDGNSLLLPPVPAGRERPLWSVLIPTWNCARYLEEALLSVLAQDRGIEKMEIIVVDDHSTRDDPEEVVDRLGGARVKFVRQKSNVGKVRNYESGLLLSRGTLIHQLHGDDKVLPGFYEAMEHAFTGFPEAGAFFCESYYIDERSKVTGRTGSELPETGLLGDWLETIVVGQRMQTPSVVLKRSTYEALGGFDRRLDLFEDWEMWIRVASRYPVGFLPGALAEYRSFDGNTTAVSKDHARTLRRLFTIVDAYLPAELLKKKYRERNSAQAQYFLQLIPKLVASGRIGEVAKAYRDALSFSRDPKTFYRILNYTFNYRELLNAR